MPLEEDVQHKKPLSLPWWGLLCWMIGCALIIGLLDHLGKFDLARPTLYCIGMLGVAIAVEWKLRRHAWFWATMAILAALHVPLILFVPWTTKWVPALVAVPICIADLFMILAILSVVGKFMDRPETR